MQPTRETDPHHKVVIVDDHRMIVELLADIFERLPGYTVVGRAATGAQALTVCRDTQPDFVVLDLRLPGGSGLDAYLQIKALLPKVRALVFSGNLDDLIIKRALTLGVDGIISKASATAELKTAILSASSGRTYLCTQTSEAIRLMVQNPPAEAATKPLLSKREQAVLRHIAAGLSSKEIATALGVTCCTVNNFRARLCKKTGLHRAVQLSMYAARMGLTNEPATPAPPGL